MRKEASFDEHWGDGWPDIRDIESRLLDAERRNEMLAKGLDGGSFSIDGLYGSEGLPPRSGLVTATLYLYINADHGLMVLYDKWDGRIGHKTRLNSKGDLSRLGEFVRSFHGTPLSVGLFVSFEDGFRAIKEFIETEGEQPTSIEWVASKDLPPETFPDP